MAKRKRTTRVPKRYGGAALHRLTDDELLKLRFRDLKVKIEGTELENRVERLYDDLEKRGLDFRPHVWLSSEWFTPDGVPGIAIPFYLAHPRLAKLERSQMLEVEGGSETMCMRVLRHETGHAIDNAYRLHRKQQWRAIFGSYSKPYPTHYQPRPYSRSYVLHLDLWYAQAHPAEDFAETFAVWLTPGSQWRQRYRGWPAMRKLEYVDALMRQIAGKPQPVRTRQVTESITQISTTLGEHYHAKRRTYGTEWPDFYDRDLRRLFSDHPQFKSNPTAASFLGRVRPDLRRVVSRWTGTYQYTIDQVMIDMIDRCRELKLRLAVPEDQARTEAMIMVAVQTMNYLHEGHHAVAL